MTEQKTNYALLFTILVTLAGWGVTFGVCKNQSEINARPAKYDYIRGDGTQ